MPRDVSGRATALAFILAAAAGCQGAIDGGGAGRGAGEGGGGGGQGMDRPDRPGDRSMPPPAGASAGVAPLRRLTAAQYRNTVRDLLGIEDAVPASALPADEVIADRFFSNVLTPLRSIDLDKYTAAAQGLAVRALANLPALLPCDPAATGEAACAQRFIESFGKRAYRRPLTGTEVDRLKVVYAAGGDFRAGIGQVVEALLQSPKFLYFYEPVPARAGGQVVGQVVGVDRWAMASRLSYLFLGSMPDDALFAAAEAGELSTADQVGRQAARLMTDRRFRDTLNGFHQGWLQLGELAGAEKDATVFPAWNPALKAALAEESRRFIEHVFTEADRRLDTLLSAPFSFLGGPLFGHYGVSAPAGAGADWQRVDLPRDQRAGILTEAGLLASLAHENRTSYILRGKMIREALFCTKVPDPPANVPPEMNVSPTANARERAAQHRADPACATCHALFDPIGFAFETYDAIGRYRARDGAGAIDTRIELTATQSLNGPVAGAVDLAAKLAGAGEVRDCVARQWMRYALGRNDAAEDEGSMRAVSQAFRDADGKLPDLLLAVARSEALRFQKVAP
jgi:hypothetical protein